MKTIYSKFGNRKVLVTGHTGFKGSWLTLWLHKLGADITGIALKPKNPEDAFYAMHIDKICNDIRKDINNYKDILKVFQQTQPEVVFHLAAQPLVLESYHDPLYTFNTNIIGTANILEACRYTKSVRALLIITSDKCYENTEWNYDYRESDRLGGNDPYSASKASAEIIVNAYRKSFFYSMESLSIASARAGNVIGGGDWAENRIVPDCIRSLLANRPIKIRNPESVRPWQHVLEPLGGYIVLAEKMLEDPHKYSEAWNFGPGYNGNRTVKDLTCEVIKNWGKGEWELMEENHKNYEHGLLSLDISKARQILGWNPFLSFEESIKMTVDWYKAQSEKKNMQEFSLKQIELYRE
jgi:CDP-glucose 4,6-dehydratase